jgi:hypothetical protein
LDGDAVVRAEGLLALTRLGEDGRELAPGLGNT